MDNSHNPPEPGEFTTAWQIPKSDPNCKCNKPLCIVLHSGQRYHPCKVHPEFYVEGKRTTF